MLLCNALLVVGWVTPVVGVPCISANAFFQGKFCGHQSNVFFDQNQSRMIVNLLSLNVSPLLKSTTFCFYHGVCARYKASVLVNWSSFPPSRNLALNFLIVVFCWSFVIYKVGVNIFTCLLFTCYLLQSVPSIIIFHLFGPICMNCSGCLSVFSAVSETLPIPLDLQTNVIGFAAMSKTEVINLSYQFSTLNHY